MEAYGIQSSLYLKVLGAHVQGNAFDAYKAMVSDQAKDLSTLKYSPKICAKFDRGASSLRNSRLKLNTIVQDTDEGISTFAYRVITLCNRLYQTDHAIENLGLPAFLNGGKYSVYEKLIEKDPKDFD